MKASKRGAVCSCGATHRSRPQAAREGWETEGPQHARVWLCPMCVAVRTREYEEKRKAEEAKRADQGPDLASTLALVSLLLPSMGRRRR